jgi:FkbM family methyltransferase
MRPQDSSSPESTLAKKLLRRALGRIPFRLGITGDVRDRFLMVLDRLFSTQGSETLQEQGVRLKLDLAHANERLISYLFTNVIRHYEHTPLYRFMEELSKRAEPGIFVDIGANLGVFSFLGSRLGFESIAVEPDPMHVRFLRRNPEYVSRLFDVALSDRSGEMTFYVADDQNPGASSLILGDSSVDSSSIYGKSVTVSVMTFSALVDEQIATPGDISLIKIDVEGHEVEALRGCEAFLDQGHAPLIWCEVRGPQSGRAPSSFATATDFLEPYGYVACHYDGNHLKRFDPAEDEVRQVFDLLFAPRGFLAQWD